MAQDHENITVTTAADLAVFIIDLTSLLCLGLLLATCFVSERLRDKRHPVFINLLAILILCSGLKVFSQLVVFNWQNRVPDTCDQIFGNTTTCTYFANEPAQELFTGFQVVVADVPWIMTQIALLNLVIHLSYVLSSMVKSPSTPRVDRRREALLLLTPYFVGLFPLIELIRSIEYADHVVAWLEILLITVTSIWDVVLFLTVIRRRRKLQRLDMGYLLSLGFLAKILAFCAFRLMLATLILVFPLRMPQRTIIVGKSLSGPLVFILLGLRKDVLQIWLPWLSKGHSEGNSTLAIQRESPKKPVPTVQVAALHHPET